MAESVQKSLASVTFHPFYDLDTGLKQLFASASLNERVGVTGTNDNALDACRYDRFGAGRCAPGVVAGLQRYAHCVKAWEKTLFAAKLQQRRLGVILSGAFVGCDGQNHPVFI
jgi:hypothetical protein